MVLDAVFLGAARRPCRVADGEGEGVGVLGEEAVDEGGFACAGWTGENYGTFGFEELGGGGGGHGAFGVMEVCALVKESCCWEVRYAEGDHAVRGRGVYFLGVDRLFQMWLSM